MKIVIHVIKCIPIGIIAAVPMVFFFIVAGIGAFCGQGYKVERWAEQFCAKADKRFFTPLAEKYWSIIEREKQ